jgi:hypothetical protein
MLVVALRLILKKFVVDLRLTMLVVALRLILANLVIDSWLMKAGGGRVC